MKNELSILKKDLMHWCKICFSEAFSSWIHIKSIRTYAESILRYGLPPNFVNCLLNVEKNELKIHKILKQFYSNKEEDDLVKDKSIDQSLKAAEYFPYVLIKINTNYPLLKFYYTLQLDNPLHHLRA